MQLTRIEVIILILIGVSFVLVAYIFLVLGKTEGVKCQEDPLVYGAKALEKVNGATVQCSCNVLKPNTPTLYFSGSGKVFPEIGGFPS